MKLHIRKNQHPAVSGMGWSGTKDNVLAMVQAAFDQANTAWSGNLSLICSNSGKGCLPEIKETSRMFHVTFALRAKDHRGPGHRLHIQPDYSGKGKEKRKRSHYACWHAHRDVIRAILTAFPTARIVSGRAFGQSGPMVYDGLQGFERDYPDTNVNIGSQMFPLYFADACECPESDNAPMVEAAD